MGLRTGIEWTDATWNPVTGCTKVTAGVEQCQSSTYATGARAAPPTLAKTAPPDVALEPRLTWRRHSWLLRLYPQVLGTNCAHQGFVKRYRGPPSRS